MTKLPPKIRIGDRVFIQGMPVLALEVIDVSDRACITVRSPNGATLKAGRKTVIRVVIQAATVGAEGMIAAESSQLPSGTSGTGDSAPADPVAVEIFTRACCCDEAMK